MHGAAGLAAYRLTTACLPAAARAAPTLTSSATLATFPSLKQVDAGDLNVGYAELGASNGRPVILLHGWPYDIHSYVQVAPLLASAGYRVFVPHTRGYGTTRFVSSETPRKCQQAALARDVVAFMDALGIERAVLGGYDWGSRTVAIVAALWPERVKALVAVSGYLIVDVEANREPLSPEAERAWWYQYYFATERGRRGYERNRHAFAKLIWQIASPKWKFVDAIFEQAAASLDNPDHVDVVIDNYRWRLGLAAGEPRFEELEKKLAQRPVIQVPTITIASDFDGPAMDGRAYAAKFTGKHVHRMFEGIGHDVPREIPDHFAAAIRDVDAG